MTMQWFNYIDWAPDSVQSPSDLQTDMGVMLRVGSCVAVAITVARMILVHWVFQPLAMQLLPRSKTPINEQLKRLRDPPIYFRTQAAKDQFYAEIAKKVDVSNDDISDWIHRTSQVLKFTDSCFKFVAYTILAVIGLSVLIPSTWFWDTRQCWIGYPNQPGSAAVDWYWFLEAGLYFHLIVAHFFESRKKDFYQMLIHHCATLAILLPSWLFDFRRYGTLVMLVHDISDPFLELAKLCNYSNQAKMKDTVFVAFAAIFFITRLVLFPGKVLYTSIIESLGIMGRFPARDPLNAITSILLVLHVYWFSLIVRMVIKFVRDGSAGNDVRSDSDDD